MAIMEWSEELNVNVDAMNSEHQKLLDLMNKLHDQNEAKCAKADMLSTLNDLAAFTVKHFENEEAYMKSISFESLDSHKLIHKDLLGKFQKFKEKIELNNDPIPSDFFNFLKFWLTAHIQGVDIKYGKK